MVKERCLAALGLCERQSSLVGHSVSGLDDVLFDEKSNCVVEEKAKQNPNDFF